MIGFSWIVSAVMVGLVVGQATIPSASDYKVTGLDKFGLKDSTYAGFMPTDLQNNEEGSLFFWLAERRPNVNNTVKPEKLVIWLNGGPGCSSMVGMMWENGPFTIHDGSEAPAGTDPAKYFLKYNPYAWNEAAHVLFVEQPVRTGFSIAAMGVKEIKDEFQVATDFRNFFLSFITVFPQFKGMETFISGESYAGFYIPYIAEHIVNNQLVVDVDTTSVEAGRSTDDLIVQKDPKIQPDPVPINESPPGRMLRSSKTNTKRKSTRGRKDEETTPTPTYHRDTSIDGINLVGAAIGNGVMDYFHQEPSYAEYAYSHGLIPYAAKQRFDYDWEVCKALIMAENTPLTVGSFSKCDMIDRVKIAAGQPNEYNTATFNGYTTITSPGGPFDLFFQDPEVQEAIHVRGQNLPGINFVPEAQIILPVTPSVPVDPNDITVPVTPPAVSSSNGLNDSSYYIPPNGWLVCSDILDSSMLADRPVSAVSALQFLVDNSYMRVLLYNGEFDLNCNVLGVLHTLEDNSWRGRPWSYAARSLWRFEGDVRGEYFNFENFFAFLIVRNSGHLLPMDIPSTALEMISNFISDISFNTTPLPAEYTYTNEVAGVVETSSAPSLTSEQIAALQRDSNLLRALLGVMLVGLVAGAAYVIYQKRSSSSTDKYSPIGSTESTSFAYQQENYEIKEQPVVEFKTFKTQQQSSKGGVSNFKV